MGMNLRLVGAKRYVDARIRTTSPVEIGEVVTISDDEVAKALLEVTFIDKYDEPSSMFEVVEDEELEEESVEDESPAPAPTRKKAPAKKTTRAKAAPKRTRKSNN